MDKKQNKQPGPSRPIIRDRIVGLRRVKASSLVANPKNWRTHPAKQRDALRGILAEVGFADALLAREDGDKLCLIDGHLRAEELGDQDVPVLVLDVTEEEADKLLATIDPLAAMAESDSAVFQSLVECLDFQDASLRNLLDTIRLPDDERPVPNHGTQDAPDSMYLRPHEHYDYIVILARDSQTWNHLCAMLGIVRGPIMGREKSRFGIARGISAEGVIHAIKNYHNKPQEDISSETLL